MRSDEERRSGRERRGDNVDEDFRELDYHFKYPVIHLLICIYIHLFIYALMLPSSDGACTSFV